MNCETDTSRYPLLNFQARYLDSDLHHSSGWFRIPTDSLTDAQERKCRRLGKLLQVQPGMTVVDVGCSWGAFGRWLAGNYGVNVIGLTLDAEHSNWAAESPTDGFVIRQQSWEEADLSADRIICINALEGFVNRKTFFARSRGWLPQGGKMVLWSVIGTSPIYRVPSEDDVTDWAIKAGFSIDSLTPGLGHHYAQTLQGFLHRLDALEPQSRWERQQKAYRQRFYSTALALLRSGKNDLLEVSLTAR